MKSGQRGYFYWVQWEGAALGILLARVPDIVLGRYLVNTSFDSGSMVIAEPERRQGWRSTGPLAFSPRITDVREIPHERFAEWLTFPRRREVESWEAVVNYCGLSLTDRSYDWIQARLWMQLEKVRPESYLAEGDRLMFITRSARLHELALAQEGLENMASKPLKAP